jgi:DNA-binding FadR family transcriptional regulator
LLLKKVASFRPIKQPRVSQEVREQLKQSILLGQFKAGDRLPSERDLVEEFQVSRVAIREALRALENSGFIITRQGVNGGAYVTELTFEHIANAFLDLFLAD